MEQMLINIPYIDLLAGFFGLTWKHVVMWIIGFILIFLAVKYDYEPALLLPIGFGSILANIPESAAISKAAGAEGFLHILYNAGIANELFPVLILIAIGAMCDFSPLMRRPILIMFAAAAQLGIVATALLAAALGFTFEQAASIGIIGAANGPVSIFVAVRLAKDLLGPLVVATYLYMSLLPIIQPPVIRLLTTADERKIKMDDGNSEPVSRNARILFPLAVTLIVGLVAPVSVSLIGSLMFGSLLKESGCTKHLSSCAQTELSNVVTLLLGITIGGTMEAEKFLTIQVLYVVALGGVAIILNTACGVICAKLYNTFRKIKVNPMTGACSVSAFPRPGRIFRGGSLTKDMDNFTAQHTSSINVAGQVASIVAGGLILMLVPILVKL